MKDKESRHILGVILDMHYIDGDLEEKTWKLARKKLGLPTEEPANRKSEGKRNG